jgi:hypothetical protein
MSSAILVQIAKVVSKRKIYRFAMVEREEPVIESIARHDTEPAQSLQHTLCASERIKAGNGKCREQQLQQ